MAQICIHMLISGRVQGVWFRRFAQQHAESNGVNGWVRNLTDGRLEAMLCGEERAVRHVEVWLNKGPDLARIATVESHILPYTVYEGFELLEDEPA